jgi:Tat protein translocase TatB subunit
MSLGPEKIILILVVALIVFGPQRLPDIARQVGAAMRELRRMQDTVRGELDQVLHPDLTPGSGAVDEHVSIEETDHAALPPGPSETETPAGNASGDVADDGFAGPRSFS